MLEGLVEDVANCFSDLNSIFCLLNNNKVSSTLDITRENIKWMTICELLKLKNLLKYNLKIVEA